MPRCFIPLDQPRAIRIQVVHRTVEGISRLFDTCLAEDENLGDAIRGSAEEVAPGQESVRSMPVLDAIRASGRTGAREVLT